MDLEIPKLQLEPKGCFSTIISNTQPFGEVAPEFVHHFGKELTTQWYLWDENGIKHSLTFAINHLVPHLGNGWHALALYLGVKQPSELHFFYFGGQTFSISLKRVVTDPRNYPSFHTLSTKPTLTTYFELTLSKYAATASQLTLQKDFGDYLREMSFKNVILCTKDLDVVQCSILVREKTKISAKIGSGWRQFCQLGGYQPGDNLRFKFAGRLAANLIHVVKVNN